jgi:hypothetical protein
MTTLQEALIAVHQETSPSASSPMLVVGHFLDVLFKDHTLPKSSLMMSTSSITTDFGQPLYSCPAYSQLDFIHLILNIFSSVPKAYQVLHCKATTTEEDLSRFLKRVEKHHDQYLMLNVNKLPFKQQEVCVIPH